MPIEVEGPDGQVKSFPDGTSHEEINRQMSQSYGGKSGALAPQGLQKPGQATAASGAVMPSMQSIPDYVTDEDFDKLILSKMFPHAQQLIQKTPGYIAREELAKKVGQNLGSLEERQRGGTQVLDMLQQLGHTADEGGSTLDSAIGPLNASPAFQRAREAANVWDIMGTRKGYDLHNQLTHDIHGLTTAFISAAGKGGIQMSDARQKAFEETMGAMMKATSKKEFDKIKVDADRIIRGTFGLQPGAAVSPTQSTRATQPAAPKPQGQIYHNPTTGEKIQWDGKAWQKVN